MSDSKTKIIIVKCLKCGTEYEMPDIGIKPIMKDCPVCKELDKKMKEMFGDLFSEECDEDYEWGGRLCVVPDYAVEEKK